jgi:hypothetical protein
MGTLKQLNKLIKDEHGNPVTLDNLWSEAGIDSFGTTMVLCDMDGIYGCFDKEWLNAVDWEILTIRDIVERADNAGTKL